MQLLHSLSLQILHEIEEAGIKIYQFPDTVGGDEEEASANKKLRVCPLLVPSCTLGSVETTCV